MKKKLLVVFTGSMELGGIERSLIGLLDSIDYNQYEVDLFLYGHHGPLFHLINSNVNILPEVKELAYLRESFGTKIKHRCYYSALMRLRDEIISKNRKINFDQTWCSVMRKYAPKLEKHYDIALGFFRPFDYIIEKVNSTVKIGWIHTDYTDADINEIKADYERLDYAVAVSEQCKTTFVNIIPEMSNRTIVIENILSKSFIEKQAEEKIKDSDFYIEKNKFTLVSVGRYCQAKNFDNIPEICQYICEKGFNIKWYIIGFGEDEALIKKNIVKYNVQDKVIMLGKKENPYPYIKACDLYVQPSRYEGKCVAVREAQILCRPVVITRYRTSRSQLIDGYDGVIVPMDNLGCAIGIAQVLRNKELREKLQDNMKNTDYTNSAEVEKIYTLMQKTCVNEKGIV